MSDWLKDEKARIRRVIKDRLVQAGEAAWREWSEQITSQILGLAEYQEAHAIMVYLSLPGEYQTESLLRHSLESGKIVCAPKVDWSSRRMAGSVLRSVDDVVTDDHGLAEPRSGEVFAPESLDLVLVPGLAFDRWGRRLGRGGGFYDRFLAQRELRACKVAALFELQLVDELEVADHDQPIDVLVTPDRVIRINSS